MKNHWCFHHKTFCILVSIFALGGCTGPDAGKYIGTTTGAIVGMGLSKNLTPMRSILATGTGAILGGVAGSYIDQKRAQYKALNQQRIQEEIANSLNNQQQQFYRDSKTGFPVSVIPLERTVVQGQEQGRFRCIVNPGPQQSIMNGIGYRNNDGSWTIKTEN